MTTNESVFVDPETGLYVRESELLTFFKPYLDMYEGATIVANANHLIVGFEIPKTETFAVDYFFKRVEAIEGHKYGDSITLRPNQVVSKLSVLSLLDEYKRSLDPKVTPVLPDIVTLKGTGRLDCPYYVRISKLNTPKFPFRLALAACCETVGEANKVAQQIKLLLSSDYLKEKRGTSGE